MEIGRQTSSHILGRGPRSRRSIPGQVTLSAIGAIINQLHPPSPQAAAKVEDLCTFLTPPSIVERSFERNARPRYDRTSVTPDGEEEERRFFAYQLQPFECNVCGHSASDDSPSSFQRIPSHPHPLPSLTPYFSSRLQLRPDDGRKSDATAHGFKKNTDDITPHPNISA